MHAENQPHVEAFDASYGTAGDYAGTTYSAHPEDPTIVPSRTAAEQAELEQEREERAKRAQAIWAEQHERELAAAQGRPKPEVDPEGNLIPLNDGAYRCDDWEQLEAERHAIAQVDEPEERRHYSPSQSAYLGQSVESLMAHPIGDKRKNEPTGRARAFKPVTSNEEAMQQYG